MLLISPVGKKINFFGEFLKKETKVGSVAPSSKYLVKKMIEPIDFSKAKTIIEFGPGTGVITVEILKKIRADARLIVFEINDEFIEGLKEIRDTRMEVISESAENIEKYIVENEIGKIDYIISSLPLAMMPKKEEYAILNSVKRALTPNGTLVQFQYSIASLKKLKEIFDDVKIDFTPMNVPPAFVFTCRLSEEK